MMKICQGTNQDCFVFISKAFCRCTESNVAITTKMERNQTSIIFRFSTCENISKNFNIFFFVIFLIKHDFSYNIHNKSSDQERKTYIIARRVTERANILGVVLKCEQILIEEEITLKIKNNSVYADKYIIIYFVVEISVYKHIFF